MNPFIITWTCAMPAVFVMVIVSCRNGPMAPAGVYVDTFERVICPSGIGYSNGSVADTGNSAAELVPRTWKVMDVGGPERLSVKMPEKNPPAGAAAEVTL